MDKEITFNGKKYRPVFIGGYWRNRSTTDPRTYLSRDMVEFYIGNKLSTNTVVHHTDGNSLHDELDNFFLRARWEHSRGHLLGIKRSAETRRENKCW